MQVNIIEMETGKVIGTYTIYLGGMNYEPSEQEFFSEAWRCAVEDGIVEEDSREKYEFERGQ